MTHSEYNDGGRWQREAMTSEESIYVLMMWLSFVSPAEDIDTTKRIVDLSTL